MNRDLMRRLARRTLVVAATVAVLGVGVMTVQVAAQWRAEAAPLDTAPVSMTTITDDIAAETDRATTLTDQVDGIAKEIADLEDALVAANSSVETDAGTAASLQTDLDAATTKLVTVQGQLTAAEARLVALNKAAARQAAINRAANVRRTTTTTTTRPAVTPEPHDD